MPFDLYVWAAPRIEDPEQVHAALDDWERAGADPAAAPFEPSTDIGWFHRELLLEFPELQVVTDAVPNASRRPVWLAANDVEPPARIVALDLPAGARSVVESIVGLAAKYDLVVFDARADSVHLPLAELAEYASATFWPRGAIQAAVAGGAGGAIAVAAWLLGIPIVSGLIALVGGFMFVMAVFTFVHEGRKRLAGRRQRTGD